VNDRGPGGTGWGILIVFALLVYIVRAIFLKADRSK
jgi:hypothetical protein